MKKRFIFTFIANDDEIEFFNKKILDYKKICSNNNSNRNISNLIKKIISKADDEEFLRYLKIIK